ncbi:MAG TPA: aminotransferase class I/II-fold pyridoxal phosphate-dependent enzyme [Pyrinomonadaceae bacterium]|nr:aminotransferase class I/II-fold pyridoxal phosphate-dependent enzyme [Pyrinomonadaceae bacterium]
MSELLGMDPQATHDLGDLRLGYTETLGNPGLRREIASLYTAIDPNQVLVHTGAEEAIFNFMNSTLHAGDHIVVQWPCYQSLYDVAQSIGCEVTKWETREEERWELDLDFLKRNLRPRTKVVVINCPHNPTGYLMSNEKLLEIDGLSKEHGFIIFSDEVYRGLEYDEGDRLPALCDINDKAVSLGVMSKTFGLAGLRIGWIATGNRDVYEQMNSLKHYTTICNSAPSEFLATLALRNKDQIVHRNRRIILDNLKTLDTFFDEHRDCFNWQRPKAGPIAFPSLARDEDVAQFCHDVVTKAGVLLLPGTIYNASGRNFRIGFGRRSMTECLERFGNYLTEESN